MAVNKPLLYNSISQRLSFPAYLLIAACASVAIAAIFALCGPYNQWLSITSMCVSLLLALVTVARVLDNWLFFLPALLNAYAVYSVLAVIYLNPDPTLLWTSLSNTEYAYVGSEVTFIFQTTLFVMFKSIPKYALRPCRFLGAHSTHPALSCALIAICVMLGFFFYGHASTDAPRVGGGVLYEYLIVPLVLAFWYLPRSRGYIVYAFSAVALLMLNSLVHGNRAESLPMVAAAIFILVGNSVTPRKTLPFLIIGVVCMQAVGVLRLSENQVGDPLGTVIRYLSQNRFAWDTAYSSYYTSLTFIASLDFTSLAQRAEMFIGFLISIVAGGSAGSSSDLASYTSRFFLHYNGGYLPIYLYFYLGFLGAFFSGVIVSAYYRLAARIGSGLELWSIIVVYFSCTSFRWLLYSPSQLLRGPLLLAICYLLLRPLADSDKSRKVMK